MESEEGLAGSLDITWAPPVRGRALGGLWCLPRPRPPALQHQDHVTLVRVRGLMCPFASCNFNLERSRSWDSLLGFSAVTTSPTRAQPEVSTGCGNASLVPGEPGSGAGRGG